MKLLLFVASLATIAAVFTPNGSPADPKRDELTILIGGNLAGKLMPCGCTSPMSGGIVRRATVYRNHVAAGRTLLLDTGDWITSAGDQDTMKAEAVADALASTEVDAILQTDSFKRLPDSVLQNLKTLSASRWIESDPLEIKGCFVRSVTESTLSTAIADLANQPQAQKRFNILITEGDEAEARNIAKTWPKTSLVVYKSVGHPNPFPLKVGHSWLVSPGMGGKSVVEVKLSNFELTSYRPIELSESIHADPVAQKITEMYHSRVARAGFLDKLPRSDTPDYAGSVKCSSCHLQAANTWRNSSHSHALQDLERVKSDRDPDCVSCHVVGLDSSQGFRSRVETPELANVGCESCHGPGASHALQPSAVHLGKVGLDRCASCHDAENSPGFDPQTTWRKISHG